MWARQQQSIYFISSCIALCTCRLLCYVMLLYVSHMTLALNKLWYLKKSHEYCMYTFVCIFLKWCWLSAHFLFVCFHTYWGKYNLPYPGNCLIGYWQILSITVRAISLALKHLNLIFYEILFKWWYFPQRHIWHKTSLYISKMVLGIFLYIFLCLYIPPDNFKGL